MTSGSNLSPWGNNWRVSNLLLLGDVLITSFLSINQIKKKGLKVNKNKKTIQK